MKNKSSIDSDFDYENEIIIDEGQLEVEWRTHPQLVLKYQIAKASSLKEFEEAKEHLELTIAEVDTSIREEFASEGQSKPTEKAIDKMVIANEEVINARAAVIDANYRVNMLRAACDAFDTRTQSLQNLVKLYGMNYYSEPTQDLQTRGGAEKLQQKARKERLKERESRRGSIEDQIPSVKKKKLKKLDD